MASSTPRFIERDETWRAEKRKTSDIDPVLRQPSQAFDGVLVANLASSRPQGRERPPGSMAKRACHMQKTCDMASFTKHGCLGGYRRGHRMVQSSRRGSPSKLSLIVYQLRSRKNQNNYGLDNQVGLSWSPSFSWFRKHPTAIAMGVLNSQLWYGRKIQQVRRR